MAAGGREDHPDIPLGIPGDDFSCAENNELKSLSDFLSWPEVIALDKELDNSLIRQQEELTQDRWLHTPEPVIFEPEPVVFEDSEEDGLFRLPPPPAQILLSHAGSDGSLTLLEPPAPFLLSQGEMVEFGILDTQLVDTGIEVQQERPRVTRASNPPSRQLSPAPQPNPPSRRPSPAPQPRSKSVIVEPRKIAPAPPPPGFLSTFTPTTIRRITGAKKKKTKAGAKKRKLIDHCYSVNDRLDDLLKHATRAIEETEAPYTLAIKNPPNLGGGIPVFSLKDHFDPVLSGPDQERALTACLRQQQPSLMFYLTHQLHNIGAVTTEELKQRLDCTVFDYEEQYYQSLAVRCPENYKPGQGLLNPLTFPFRDSDGNVPLLSFGHGLHRLGAIREMSQEPEPAGWASYNFRARPDLLGGVVSRFEVEDPRGRRYKCLASKNSFELRDDLTPGSHGKLKLRPGTSREKRIFTTFPLKAVRARSDINEEEYLYVKKHARRQPITFLTEQKVGDYSHFNTPVFRATMMRSLPLVREDNCENIVVTERDIKRVMFLNLERGMEAHLRFYDAVGANEVERMQNLDLLSRRIIDTITKNIADNIVDLRSAAEGKSQQQILGEINGELRMRHLTAIPQTVQFKLQRAQDKLPFATTPTLEEVISVEPNEAQVEAATTPHSTNRMARSVKESRKQSEVLITKKSGLCGLFTCLMILNAVEPSAACLRAGRDVTAPKFG